MVSINGVAQDKFSYSAKKTNTVKSNAFSNLLQQTAKSQKNNRDSIEISKRIDIKELSDKYDVHHLGDTERVELLEELKQAGEIDCDFDYGFVRLPITLDELRHNPQCMLEFVPGKSSMLDCTDMVSFSKQIADSQMALYQKLKYQGKDIPELKKQSEQYRKLASILQKLEK